MPSFEFTSPEGKTFTAQGATASDAWDVLQAQELAADKGMKFEPLTKTRGEYVSEIPGKVAESLLPTFSKAPSDQAAKEFRNWQEDQLKATGYAPFAPWERGGNPVLGAAELGSLLPFGAAGAGAKTLAAGAAEKILPAMAGFFPKKAGAFGNRSVPYGFWSQPEAQSLVEQKIKEGWTRQQIHDYFGKGALDMMKRLGIGTGRPSGRTDWVTRPGIPPNEKMEEAKRLAAEGKMTWAEIGQALGLGGKDPKNVRHLLRRYEARQGKEELGVTPVVDEWETDPVTGVRSRIIKADPMQREVLERGRSGRPVRTEPLPQNDEEILQRGFDRNAVFAYHASPHDFEKFDLSNMGTGQGVQSYGAGHYLAENPEVSGRGGAYDKEFSGKQLHDLNPAQRTAGHLLIELNGDRDAAYRSAIDGARTYQGASRGKLFVEAAELIKSGWEPPKAKIYETVIKSPQEHFLDWDRPLSEQPPQATAALDRLAAIAGKEAANEGRPTPNSVFMLRDKNASFDDFHRQFAKYDFDPIRAAEMMHEAGIPGIKYLDQGSRDAGKGTRNYVVFDDKTIHVLKKYGIAGPLGAGGAAAALNPDSEQ